MKTKILFPLMLMLLAGCSKDWFEAKSNKSIVVPSKIADLQALLDNTEVMNGNQWGYGVLPSMGAASSEEYHVEDDVFNNLSAFEKNVYIWNKEIYDGSTSYDWNKGYITVFYANTVLDNVGKITETQENLDEINNIKGSALFFRAHAFFHLAQIFAAPYNANTANEILGIPLRLSSDFNEPTTRSTLLETYEQVLADLKDAYDLLPEVPVYKTRPSRPAVDALLARVYLVMADYGNALKHADKCLSVHNKLIDYSTIDVSRNPTFDTFNDEVIFDASLTYNGSLDNHIINEDLYTMYEENDLRRIAYFDSSTGNIKFKGSYIGSIYVNFGGIAVDEVYLIRAECNARLGRLSDCARDINTMLENRYTKNGNSSTHTPLVFNDQETALSIILNERRKELLFRGLRWMDLRRLNSEGMSISLSRYVGGNTYTLEPNSNRYTFPIPDDVMNATGIEQNNR